MTTNEDNLDFATSQAVDGVLSDFDAHNLGEKLNSPEARAMAADHEKLNVLLRSYDPLPPVDFDKLAASVSAAIANEETHVAPPVPMRTTWTRRLAYAAAVGLVALAGWPFLSRPAATGGGGNGSVVTDIGPATPTANGTIEVRVGPSELMVKRGLIGGLGTEPVGDKNKEKDKSRVVITSATAPSELRPF